jgi:hypothetical protein
MFNRVGHLLNNLHRAIADGADPLQQINDVFFIIGKFVSVEQFGDRRVFRGLFFVLVEYPFQGGFGIEDDFALGFVCL